MVTTALTSSSPATETAVLTESRLWLRLLVSMVRVKAMAESVVTVAWRGLNFAFYPPCVVPVLGRAGSNQLVQTFPWLAAGTMAAEARRHRAAQAPEPELVGLCQAARCWTTLPDSLAP